MKSSEITVEERNKLPQKCGVYFFYDRSNRLLYIGKANNLKDRAGSYFSSPKDFTPKTKILVSCIAKIGFELCESEIEALIRETYLIKRFLPKYNIKLRDDKSFSYLVFDKESDFPRVYITRKMKPGIGEIVGPFSDSQTLKQSLKFIRNIFPFRDCRTFPKKPCLQYHLGRCGAPCIGEVGMTEYFENIRLLKRFFKTGPKEIRRYLEHQMKEESDLKRFEKAAQIRDQLELLKKLKSYQKISDSFKKTREGLGAVVELYKFLNIHSKNYRIEGYDISNIKGQYACGSQIVLEGGKPKKSEYRKFKIKNIDKIDDYQMIKEVLERRFKHDEWRKPGLIVIDGGKGHLNIALEVLKSIGLKIPTIALAKKYEAVYTKGSSLPLFLPKNSSSLYLLMRLRDEAHRFGKKYYVALHRKGSLMSKLEEIPGIGPKIRIKLLKHFGSLEKIKKTNIQELNKVVNCKLAKTISTKIK